MLAMTAGGYLIAWGPFAGLCIWEMVTQPRVGRGHVEPGDILKIYTQDIPADYRFTASLFCKSATAYNPFIYFFMFRGFREDTRTVLNR